MKSYFKHFDPLHLFTIVSQFDSFSAAAESLNLTKGAISHQIRTLESVLGFSLFVREPRGVSLTQKGEKLLAASTVRFSEIEELINHLGKPRTPTLTLGTTTYFASRWLSQRLMNFMQQYPEVQIRLQPMISFTDLDTQGIDLAIRWGDGDWTDHKTQLLFSCPAWPTGSEHALRQVERLGFYAAFSQFPLLHDRQHSNAWKHWYKQAGMTYPEKENKLIIPDPNVRVEAVIEGQGIALNDSLIERELSEHRLYRLSDIELSEYGYYLIYGSSGQSNPVVAAFSQWILGSAEGRNRDRTFSPTSSDRQASVIE